MFHNNNNELDILSLLSASPLSIVLFLQNPHYQNPWQSKPPTHSLTLQQKLDRKRDSKHRVLFCHFCISPDASRLDHHSKKKKCIHIEYHSKWNAKTPPQIYSKQMQKKQSNYSNTCNILICAESKYTILSYLLTSGELGKLRHLRLRFFPPPPPGDELELPIFTTTPSASYVFTDLRRSLITTLLVCLNSLFSTERRGHFITT